MKPFKEFFEGWERTKNFSYLVNPSTAQIVSLTKRYGHGRWVEDANTKEFYFVNAKDATHWDIIRDVIGVPWSQQEEGLDTHAAGHTFFVDNTIVMMNWDFQDNSSTKLRYYTKAFDEVLTHYEFVTKYPQLASKL